MNISLRTDTPLTGASLRAFGGNQAQCKFKTKEERKTLCKETRRCHLTERRRESTGARTSL